MTEPNLPCNASDVEVLFISSIDTLPRDEFCGPGLHFFEILTVDLGSLIDLVERVGQPYYFRAVNELVFVKPACVFARGDDIPCPDLKLKGIPSSPRHVGHFLQ